VHPVRVDIDYVEKRSRLTTFFRLILVIPHYVFLSVFGLVAFVVTLIAWFAVVITGRYPEGMWNLSASYVKYAARVLSYLGLAVDPFPPFSGDGPYPVQTTIQRPERQSRWKALFRIILIFPAAVIVSLLGYAVYSVAFILWLWIVFVGRSPKGLHDFMATSVEYYTRFNAYFLLLVDAYPNFDQDDQPRLRTDELAPV
jgi:hypothetical protein